MDCIPSSWQNLLTLVRPDSAPLASLRWSTPKSAYRSGSSRWLRSLWPNTGKTSQRKLQHKNADEISGHTQGVSRAVHRLKSKLGLVDVKDKLQDPLAYER